MAPMEASAYLPPLDGCLEGDKQILSWQLACAGLAEGDAATRQPAVTKFFDDARTVTSLIHSLEAQPRAKSDAKAEFDTYTSAINISPNGNGNYDLKQIKEDALWLSKENKIDEVTALRVTVLEWQSRSAVKLQQLVSHDASLGLSASLRLRSSLLRSLSHSPISATDDGEAFNSQTARRLRILKTWCFERQFQFKCLEQIIVKTFEDTSEASSTQNRDPATASASGSEVWRAAGRMIVSSWDKVGTGSSQGPRWLSQTIDYLRRTTQQIQQGSGILQDEVGYEEFQLLWCETKSVELVYALHLIATTLQASSTLSGSDEFTSWFQFMSEVNFFDEFEIPFAGPDSDLTYFMRSLSIITTLALLNIPLALDQIGDVASLPASAENTAGRTYLHSGKALETATITILDAMNRACMASQPVGLAWSIILQEARERTQHFQDSRDQRLSQRAYDSLGHSQASDSESNDSAPSRARPTLNRRTSFGSDTSQQTTLLEHNIECVQKIDQEDVINLVARSSLHGPGAFGGLTDLALGFCAVFGSGRSDKAESRLRCLLLQVVEASLGHVQYGSDIVSTVLALLSRTQESWQSVNEVRLKTGTEVDDMFLQSPILMERVFEMARARFPFEDDPFLELCSALAQSHIPGSTDSFITASLKELQSYTTTTSEQDVRYDLMDDEPNFIEIQTRLDVYGASGSLGPSQQLAIPSNIPFAASPRNLVMATIPEGTRGLVLSETKPMVVQFELRQSGFGYLGRMVQQAALTYSSTENWNLEAVLRPATKVIGLLTKLLQQANPERANATDRQLSGHVLLEAFSDNMDRNGDIVSVIFDIFENELYDQHSVTGGPVTEVLAQCVQFVHALLPIQPARVWPFLARSSFLGLDGVESRFLGVVASQEMPVGRYPFMMDSLHLFEALAEDVVSRSVSKNVVSTALARFESSTSPSTSAGTKDSQVAQILYYCTKHMVDMFESSGKLKFAAYDDKLKVQHALCRMMRKILGYCFGADDSTQISEKIVSALAPSADYLVDVFLSRSKNEGPIEPFIQNLRESLQTPASPLLEQTIIRRTAQTVSTIELAESLIRINAYLGRPPCRIEEQLFACAEILVRIFAVHERHRKPVILLLFSLITSSSRTSEQPPSLLGYLGQQSAKWFLELLSALDGPLRDTDYNVAVWKFLSAVVSQRQQWFAIYLLTGKTARHTLREKDTSKSSTHVRSLLEIATSKLSRLDLLEPPEAAGMLEFVALAADFWLWVPERLAQNSAFLKEVARFLAQQNEKSNIRGTTDDGGEAMDVQIAASIANIFAMIVHRANETRDVSFAKQVSPHLSYFVKAGVSSTAYNMSLHRSLQKNFEAKFPKCKVSNFKRTSVHASPLGRNFFYDVDLAHKVLSFDKSWARQDGKGFLHEVERANLNLSLVQAQINLFHAWKSLAVEIALALGTEKVVQVYMSKVICACLESNQQAILPEGIFEKLAQARADLAFVLLQRLIQVARTEREARLVLEPAWSTLRGHAPDLGLALTGTDANYDRTLVRILYLALQAHLPDPQEGTKKASGPLAGPKLYALVLDVLGTCVAQGFRSTVSLLHEDYAKVVPTDLALLNAILRTCLRIPGIERQTEQLVAQFADNQTARYASTLFSWAHQLKVGPDPVYGELSMEFLVELSTVPALAESIVLSGVLSQISASTLSDFLTRPGGSGPFDEPSRMHVIWTRGILPLVTNLLRAIEAPIAGDVATFLDQFQPQLERVSQCLDPKPSRPQAGSRAGFVTLNMASEVHSLALICSILDMFREAGAGAGIAPNEIPRIGLETGVLRSDLETRLQRRNALREDIVAMDEREEAWARQKPTNPITNSESLLEQKIVEELKGAFAVLGEQE